MNFARHQSDYMVTLHNRTRVLEDQQAANEEHFTTLSDDFLSFLKNLDVSGQDTNILIGDNSSESFAIVEGETPYLTFDTTNSSEKVICAKPLINTDATQSTSKDTGCLILEGGIGIEKNANVGGSLTVTGATTLNGGLTMDTNKFTVADSSGNTYIDGTLSVAGVTALNGGLTIDTNKFIVADETGNTSIAGTLSVTGVTILSNTLGVSGASTLASANVTGSTTIGGGLSVTGTTALNGGLTMDTNKFTVADETGNTSIAGTLGVTGLITAGTGGLTSTAGTTTLGTTSATGLTVSGTTAMNGGLTMDTNKFTVADETGNTSIAGTLGVTGLITAGTGGLTSTAGTTTLGTTSATGLTVSGTTALNGGLTMDTNKFTVANDSGNTLIAGTLEVSGIATLSNNASVAGTLGVTGAATFYSITQSSSTSTGSIVTGGGLGVAKNAYFGGSLVEKYTAYSGLVNFQSITIDLAAGNNTHLGFSSGGSKTITINNPVNASSVIGQSGFIIVDLNGSNNAIEWGSDWKFKTSPVASTTATFDVIRYYVFSSTRILCNYETDVNSVYFFMS